jgi:hypothetical protein
MMPAKFVGIQSSIEANSLLMNRIADVQSEMFEGHAVEHGGGGASAELVATEGPWEGPRPPDFDMDKVYTTLKQFVRDWAVEGVEDREKCYQPILDEIDQRFAGRDPSTISIVVPGAGLGRLVWECAKRGFKAQGNEVCCSHFLRHSRFHVRSSTPFMADFLRVWCRLLSSARRLLLAPPHRLALLQPLRKLPFANIYALYALWNKSCLPSPSAPNKLYFRMQYARLTCPPTVECVHAARIKLYSEQRAGD